MYYTSYVYLLLNPYHYNMVKDRLQQVVYELAYTAVNRMLHNLKVKKVRQA